MTEDKSGTGSSRRLQRQIDEALGLIQKNESTIEQAASALRYAQSAGLGDAVRTTKDEIERVLRRGVVKLPNATVSRTVGELIGRTYGSPRSLAREFFSADLRAAFAAVQAAAGVQLPTPSVDGWDRLATLVESRELEEEFVGVAERAIADDPQLSQAIDEAAQRLVVAQPNLNRELVRETFCLWVAITWAAMVYLMIYEAPDAVSDVADAVGVWSGRDMYQRIGRIFDSQLWPQEDEDAAPGEGG